MRTANIKRPVAIAVAVLLAALTAALGLALAGAEKAEAAFPGKNGKIALSIDRNSNEDIYTINPDGSGERRLTTDPDDERNPDWAPDGRRIVFNDVRQFGTGADIDTEIFIMNADGSGLRQITNLPGADGSFRPVFSPDGKQIAFIGDRNNDFDVFVMNADGSGERKVIDADAFSVAFSPDGKKLAYTSFENGGNADVFSVNLDGSGKTRLTTDPDFDAVADFSPSGEKIAFFSNRDSFGDIFVMNADGSDERILTEGGEASFSPNGKKIVVEVISGSGGLAVANAADASGRVNITPNSLGNENAPDWGAALNTKPVISGLRPPKGAKIKDRTPLVRAVVVDRKTNLAKDNIKLFFDGKRRGNFSYNRATNVLTFRPATLDFGLHKFRVEARDGAGATTVKGSSFRVVR